MAYFDKFYISRCIEAYSMYSILYIRNNLRNQTMKNTYCSNREADDQSNQILFFAFIGILAFITIFIG